MRFSMDSILQNAPDRLEVSPRKRTHSSTNKPTIHKSQPLKCNVKSSVEHISPSPDTPSKKKPKLIDNTSPPPQPINARSKLSSNNEVVAPKEDTKHTDLDPLASLAAFERPSTSSSSSLASLDDDDELEKRLDLVGGIISKDNTSLVVPIVRSKKRSTSVSHLHNRRSVRKAANRIAREGALKGH